MTVQVSIVVGNPKPRSRTRTVAETFTQKLLGGSPHEIETIDLVDHAADLFSWPNAGLDALNARVAASDLAVFASPTYKASYTGLLKAFLDRYPAGGLTGVTAIPVFTGADLTHSMAPTVTLAPLLVELGATVPGRGLYFVVSNMDRLDEIVQEAADACAANLRRVAAVSSGLPELAARP